MELIQKLASALGRRDEEPNIHLAHQLALAKDKKSIQTLVNFLNTKPKAIQNDCVKVLYEIGVLHPELIQPHLETFVRLLQSKNNRLVWGAMTAIATISKIDKKGVSIFLGEIMKAADKGSVITKDSTVNVLIQLCNGPDSAALSLPLLKEMISHAPVNQLPMYAEKALAVMRVQDRSDFMHILEKRAEEEMKESKRKRVQKVLELIKEA